MKKLLKYMTFYDKILISFIIFVSLLSIFFPFRALISGEELEDGSQVIVIRSENDILEIPVADTYTAEAKILPIEGPTGITEVEVYEGRVRVKKEPEEHFYRIAERQGWIDKNNLSTTIINMPNKIAIWIETREEDEFDGIVY